VKQGKNEDEKDGTADGQADNDAIHLCLRWLTHFTQFGCAGLFWFGLFGNEQKVCFILTRMEEGKKSTGHP